MKNYILRAIPLFEIKIGNESFEIHNSDYNLNNGTYHFQDILIIQLKEKKVDWFGTLLGNLIGFFLGGSDAGYDTIDASFNLEYRSGKKVKIKLINCDSEIINRVYQEIRQRV